jgi:tmRNA-binding protein
VVFLHHYEYTCFFNAFGAIKSIIKEWQLFFLYFQSSQQVRIMWKKRRNCELLIFTLFVFKIVISSMSVTIFIVKSEEKKTVVLLALNKKINHKDEWKDYFNNEIKLDGTKIKSILKFNGRKYNLDFFFNFFFLKKDMHFVGDLMTNTLTNSAFLKRWENNFLCQKRKRRKTNLLLACYKVVFILLFDRL